MATKRKLRREIRRIRREYRSTLLRHALMHVRVEYGATIRGAQACVVPLRYTVDSPDAVISLPRLGLHVMEAELDPADAPYAIFGEEMASRRDKEGRDV